MYIYPYIAAPSFAETIKAGEPISSVILGYFYFNEGMRTCMYNVQCIILCSPLDGCYMCMINQTVYVNM